MLELHSGIPGEKIIVTLTELATLTSPNYLFVFEHVETKKTVAFVAGPDESQFPARYNQFNIDTDTLFADKPSGEWHYSAYEQASSSNTDPSLVLNLLESGKMFLYSAEDFEFDMYNQPVTYKSYAG